MNTSDTKVLPPESSTGDTNPNKRITSLDQFRGYAVAAMVLVNFLGNYACAPRILRHTNDYCSYADTIMPNFLFAVGFSIAVVWARALAKEAQGLGISTKSLNTQARRKTARPLQLKLARRSLSLMVFAFLLYFPWGQSDLGQRIGTIDFWFAIAKRDWFQTLTHIACTTLWLLPILNWTWRGRLLWIAFGVSLHVALSEWRYFHWVHESPGGIDGGPLGFLTWSLPACAGLWAGEEFLSYKRQLINSPSNPNSESRWYTRWLMLACSWMLIGWLLSCLSRSYDVEVLPTQSTTDSSNTPQRLANSPVALGVQVFAQGTNWKWAEPPFVPPPSWKERTWNYWMMSQKAGTLSYLVFAAGFSMALFVVWDWLVVRYSIEIPFLRSFGKNALVCYAVHGFLIDAIGTYVPRDAAPWLVIASLTGLLFSLFALAWILERRRIFIRL